MQLLRLAIFILVAYTALAADPAILRQRVNELLPSALEAHQVDLWIVFTREEAKDPLAVDLAGGSAVARMALLFARTDSGFQKIAIAAGYDIAPLKESGIYDEIISYKSEGVKPHLLRVVEGLDPARIALNTSRDMPVADGLTTGMRLYLVETLGPRIAKKFVSSEPLVGSFRGRRLASEVGILREAALYTDKIIREALSSQVIQAGRTTENGVGDYLKEKTAELGATVPFISVVAGPARGHSEPSDRVIVAGDLVRIDFGITYKGYSTDIQRTAYVLRPGEKQAPSEVQKMWDTTRLAADRQIAAMKPGVTGHEIDTIGRGTLTDAGYSEPPHGTGHAIGFAVHDVGPLLGPDWPERYGSTVFLKMEVGQTFAVEPILYANYEPSGGEINIGLEEDVVITEEGAARLHPRQDEMILIETPGTR